MLKLLLESLNYEKKKQHYMPDNDIMKLIEFNVRITKIIKNKIFNVRIMKIIIFLLSLWTINKNQYNFIITSQNNEDFKIIRIPI